MGYIRATVSKGERGWGGGPEADRAPPDETACPASSSRPDGPREAPSVSAQGGGAERGPPGASLRPSEPRGRERPSGTSARARKFQAATVTAASTFFPRTTRLLPLLNFSRELTRHFRALNAAVEEGQINPRAPGPEMTTKTYAFPPPILGEA